MIYSVWRVSAFWRALLSAGSAAAQVITIDTNGSSHETVKLERWTAAFSRSSRPTFRCRKSELDAKTRLELIRFLQAEQGFAMRPFPRGHKGLTLVANGKLEPAGEAYLNMVTSRRTLAPSPATAWC